MSDVEPQSVDVIESPTHVMDKLILVFRHVVHCLSSFYASFLGTITAFTL